MYGYLKNKLNSYKELVNYLDFKYVIVQFTKINTRILDISFDNGEPVYTHNLNQVVSQARQNETAQKLRVSLGNISLLAWNKTETLLFKEVKRHPIQSESINSEEVAKDSLKIHKIALELYTQHPPLRQFSMVRQLACVEKSLSSRATSEYSGWLPFNQLAKTIDASLGDLRQKYTQQDSRLIDFVSMQFYHISLILSQLLSHAEKSLPNDYFKVIDDNLYMPLQLTRTLAAKVDYDCVALMTLKHFLSSRVHISKSITKRIIEPYSGYYSCFGYLNNPKFTVSNIREVKKLRVHLWVCALFRRYLYYRTKMFLLVCNALCNLKTKLGNNLPNASPITTEN